MLLAVLAHNRGSQQPIETLRVPGLGTGIGAMPLNRAAVQMQAAYVSVFESPDWLRDPAAILVQREKLSSV